MDERSGAKSAKRSFVSKALESQYNIFDKHRLTANAWVWYIFWIFFISNYPRKKPHLRFRSKPFFQNSLDNLKIFWRDASLRHLDEKLIGHFSRKG